MLKESQAPRYAVRRTHRTYTPQFKAELVAACQQPGASIAALALQHGMNTNVLHRWLKEYGQGRHRLAAATAPSLDPALAPRTTPAFVPLELNAVAPSCAFVPPVQASPAAVPALATIRLDCQRQGVSMTVHWPLSAAAECAQMLREWLR
jgi:transposase-like protein